MSLKERFEYDYKNIGTPKMIVVAVELPGGGIETITNYHNTNEKCEYYLKMYNEKFELIHNNNVKIVGYMIV